MAAQSMSISDANPLTGEIRRNFGHEGKSVVIENVSLDTAGFQFYKHASKHTMLKKYAVNTIRRALNSSST
jgi:hypothetical protein